MADMSAAERRTTETKRLLDAGKRLAKRFGVSVKAPHADADAETQRVGLLAYAADVLEAIEAAQMEEAQAKPEPAKTQTGKPDKPDKSNDAA